MNNQNKTRQPTSILGLSPFVRWGLILFFGMVLLFVTWQYWCFVQNPIDKLSPSKLGLPTIFVFSSAVLLFLLIPWEKLGLRLKKFAGLEFEQIVETQATEHAEDLSEIEDRLTSLESAIHEVHEGIQLGEEFLEPELRNLLIDFLTKYSTTAYSPTRIRVWGSKRAGFEKLEGYTPAFLRRMLRKLVAEGVLETSISRKGNTLYRIVE